MKVPEITKHDTALLWHELQEKMANAVTSFGAVKMAIERLPEKYHPMLEPVLARSVNSPSAGNIALNMLGVEYRDGILKRMVETAETRYDMHVLLGWFPFATWPVETAKEALKKAIEKDDFPNDRMSELAESLQDYVKDRLEVQAELAFLFQYKIPEDVMRRKLHPESEVVLFAHSYSHFANQPAKVYVESNELSDAGFKQLATVQRIENYGVGDIAKELIRLYANNHGLSKQNYIDLMSGPYKELAPELKGYLRSEMTAEENIDDDTVRVLGNA